MLGYQTESYCMLWLGLYDVTLTEMTPDVLYSTVCEKWARTIILVRDFKETAKDIENRLKKKKDNQESNDNQSTNQSNELANGETKGSGQESEEADEDKYVEDEATPSKFLEVFSDTESEEEEDLEEEEEDFSEGINTFINSSKERRKSRSNQQGAIKEDSIGIENRIVGCITFEKKYVRHRDRVVHLTLLTVRKRFRKYGIGRYLLQQVIDPSVVGHYDAVVVHADNAAVDFFQRFGFSDDVVLNSRWSELAEQFTNCTLMCFLPGFSGYSLLNSIKLPGFEVFELEQEFNKWKEKTIEVYQSQVSVVMRMKHEILQLKNVTDKQTTLIDTLIAENDRLKKERYIIEKEFLDYRLSSFKSTFDAISQDNNAGDAEEEINTQELITNLQRQVELMDLAIKKKRLHSLDEEHTPESRRSLTTVDDSKYLSFPSSKVRQQLAEPYDHMKDAAFFYDVTEQFKTGMELDPSVKRQHEVQTISKATLSEAYQEEYKNRNKQLKDPSMVADLYFCGTLEHPERIQDILKYGFAESDFIHGEYGRGLYFSKFPSMAGKFSALGKVMFVEVGLGNVETVTKIDRTRKSPSQGFDSIITPGRLSTKEGGDNSMHQEYVIFDHRQVLPLCLISYSGS
ncbi:hypothetical protein KUTeg_016458 [Tegillarca granosa]|uniref:N-acetyltransferase domain-containing protein n=1 Tax=Tegillarca granosa TaxID=220873 RepID=A0ABQ9EKX1_TEGGR|nr:hypothetical protein KUTeg_016458 [Tegillarca granosa]